MRLFDFIFKNKKEIQSIDRRKITAEVIDHMQQIEATKPYRNMIYQKYYSDYSEKPFVSLDREKNTKWIEQATIFPNQSIIPKSMMKRNVNGLLPGHIYMLYWLGKYNADRRTPTYFEYKYGIFFEREKKFLREKGFLDSENRLTSNGQKMIDKHNTIIDKHSSETKNKNLTAAERKKQTQKQILSQKASIAKNGFSHYVYIASKTSCTKCKELDGKVYRLNDLILGVNAPPMCENCRCSISAHTGQTESEYNQWLDKISKQNK